LIRVSLIAALLALAACGQSSRGYEPGVETNFMHACESQSTIPGLCACAWDKIEANVAPRDFAALERMSGPEREASPVKRQLDGYAQVCRAQLQQEPQPAP
jgi:hypothetical protein